jgi:hypothetical protein
MRSTLPVGELKTAFAGRLQMPYEIEKLAVAAYHDANGNKELDKKRAWHPVGALWLFEQCTWESLVRQRSKNRLSPSASKRSIFRSVEIAGRLASMLTVILLIISNVFMVVAWYGHLKFKETPIWTVILVSWGIAFFEYCFQVPANRLATANSRPRN